MEFFGSLDKSRDGRIVSHMPAWYNERQVEELREEIGRTLRALDRGEVPDSHVPKAKADLEALQRKLQDITGQKPKVGDNERNLLWKYYKALGGLIEATLFSYDEMQLGRVDPHEEARRMKDPIIALDKELVELAESCGVKPQKNMVSRDQAAKMFKICGKLLGEPTNTESLRPITRRSRVRTESDEISASVESDISTAKAGRRGRKAN